MHDHLELQQLLQHPTNDESEQYQARVHRPPEQEIRIALGADEVQHHRRGRMDPHGQPALGRPFVDGEQIGRIQERPIDIRADLKPLEPEAIDASTPACTPE